MELQFAPVRGTTDAEHELVMEARNDPATRQMIVLNVAASKKDAVKDEPKAEAKPKITYSDEPDEDEEEVVEAPKKRASKKVEAVVPEKKDLANVLAAWGDDDDDED